MLLLTEVFSSKQSLAHGFLHKTSCTPARTFSSFKMFSVPVQSGSASECYVNYIIVSLVTCHLIVNLSGDWLPICFRLSNLILELFQKTVLPRVTPFFAENGVTTGNQSDPGFVDAVKGWLVGTSLSDGKRYSFIRYARQNLHTLQTYENKHSWKLQTYRTEW